MELKLLTIQLFHDNHEQIVQTSNKGKIKSLHYCPFVRVIQSS